VAICVAAARMVNRQVRLTLARSQTFTDAGRRPELRHDVRLGAGQNGRLSAFSYDTTAETAVFDDRVVAPTPRTVPRLYACENIATTYRRRFLGNEEVSRFSLAHTLPKCVFELPITPDKLL
jgi:CO/xanthine dehydrogenase Mo-binding subunit